MTCCSPATLPVSRGASLCGRDVARPSEGQQGQRALRLSRLATYLLIEETKLGASVIFEMGEVRGAEFCFTSLNHQFLGGICGKYRIFVLIPEVKRLCCASPVKSDSNLAALQAVKGLANFVTHSRPQLGPLA